MAEAVLRKAFHRGRRMVAEGPDVEDQTQILREEDHRWTRTQQ